MFSYGFPDWNIRNNLSMLPVKTFAASKAEDQQPIPAPGDSPTVKMVLSFEDQDLVSKWPKE